MSTSRCDIQNDTGLHIGSVIIRVTNNTHLWSDEKPNGKEQDTLVYIEVGLTVNVSLYRPSSGLLYMVFLFARGR